MKTYWYTSDQSFSKKKPLALVSTSSQLWNLLQDFQTASFFRLVKVDNILAIS